MLIMAQNETNSFKSPIHYYGGKFYMTDIIISHFPKKYNLYIEGFGGGASVLLAKTDYGPEIYNDLGSNVYSLFKCLSDEKMFNELKTKLDVTYYSRDIFNQFREELLRNDLSVVDRAYRYFCISRMAFNGVGAFAVNFVCRNNMCKSVSSFISAIDGLPELHQRLSRVIVENRDIFELIEKYDNNDVFWYLDPPYLADTRTSSTKYECEMTDEDHMKFVDVLLKSKSKFLISGYDHKIYDKLVENGWNKFTFQSPNVNSDRTECLWYNYNDCKSDKGLLF